MVVTDIYNIYKTSFTNKDRIFTSSIPTQIVRVLCVAHKIIVLHFDVLFHSCVCMSVSSIAMCICFVVALCVLQELVMMYISICFCCD